MISTTEALIARMRESVARVRARQQRQQRLGPLRQTVADAGTLRDRAEMRLGELAARTAAPSAMARARGSRRTVGACSSELPRLRDTAAGVRATRRRNGPLLLNIDGIVTIVQATDASMEYHLEAEGPTGAGTVASPMLTAWAISEGPLLPRTSEPSATCRCVETEGPSLALRTHSDPPGKNGIG